MRLTVPLLVAGLLLGGFIGFLTRPDSAELKVGGFSVEVQTDRPVKPGTGGQITTGQWQRIAIFALGGAVLGFGAGFLADRRRA